MTPYSAEWFWSKHSDVALALQTMQFEYWLRQLEGVDLLEIKSSDSPSFLVRLPQGHPSVLRPGAVRSEDQECWYQVQSAFGSAPTTNLALIAVSFEVQLGEDGSSFVTLSGFSVEAVFLKLSMWLDDLSEQE